MKLACNLVVLVSLDIQFWIGVVIVVHMCSRFSRRIVSGTRNGRGKYVRTCLATSHLAESVTVKTKQEL